MPNLIQDLLSQVYAFDESCRKRGSIAWYRGHRSADWELTSTLHRHVERQTAELTEPLNRRHLLRSQYTSTYRHFKGEAWPLLNPSERTEWGIVFAMQHNGFPTRLLDWTESFGCALYFAQYQRARGEAAAIWALDPELLNSVTIHKKGIVAIDDVATATDIGTDAWHPRFPPPEHELPTIAVSPVFSNARMAAQRSKFTLSGDAFAPLNKQLGDQIVRDAALVKITVPAECFDEIEDFLRITGFRAFSFMPDMEGLLREHKARTEKELQDAVKNHPHLFGKKPPDAN